MGTGQPEKEAMKGKQRLSAILSYVTEQDWPRSQASPVYVVRFAFGIIHSTIYYFVPGVCHTGN